MHYLRPLPFGSRPSALVACVCATIVIANVCSAAPNAQAEDSPVSFQRDVRPLLTDRCFLCHGPDPATREAGLRLDNAESVTAELDSGNVAIVPGDLQASELVRRITSDDPSERMPPEDIGKPLSAAEIELLKRWVEQGAKYERHWAFEKIQRPELPTVGEKQWVVNPIDRFTLARMESAELAPSPEASKAKLARRIYFDLIGLPPTPKQLAAFENDSSSTAAERLANTLFNSPHYGERMAIDWLDGARYADTNGYQNDFNRQMWPWRDWVIRAFNDNMPFDQFTLEQLAGDLLPNPTHEQIVATGFNRNNRTVTEAGSLPEEWLVENVVDRVETTGTVFLGLTMGCSRCHDHKYDPISQKEFFEFFAFFNNITEKGVYTEKRGNVAPMVPVTNNEQAAHLAELSEELNALRKALDSADEHLPGLQHDIQKLLAGSTPPSPAVSIPLDGDALALRADEETISPRESNKVDWKPEFPGKAAQLEGRGIAYGQLFSPQPNSPYSMAAWVRPQEWGAVVSKMDSSANYRGVDLLIQNDMRLSAHLIHHWQDNAIKVVTLNSLPKNEWSHVAITYDGSSTAAGVKLYINGVVVETHVERDALSGTLETDQPFRVGQRSIECYLRGGVTDVQLFNAELTPLEVRHLPLQRIAKVFGDRFDALSKQNRDALLKYITTHAPIDGDSDISETLSQITKLEKQINDYKKKLPTVMVMEERATRRPTFVLKRGEYHSPDLDQRVEPNVPDFLPPLPEGKRDRLALAKWIVHPDNPLTARVTVNRLWARFFGRGLVKSTENFGLQAKFPSHPELLDWLAAELIHSGWDLQHIQRLIVSSATYRQSSAASRVAWENDPDNKLLTRGPRFRLPAELVRDNALAVSGLLADGIGGPSIMPYQPEGLWEELAGGAHEKYMQDSGDKLYRRSLYVFRKRTVPHPVLNTFDAPGWDICQVKRSTTNTPMQALALLNDTTYIEAARKLAERMMNEGGDTPVSRLRFAFRLTTGRYPRASESKALEAALSAYLKTFADDPNASQDFIKHGESPPAANVQPAELAAYTAVASVILNLDESVTKD